MIETGIKIGFRTMMEVTKQRKNGYTIWRHHCKCGREIYDEFLKRLEEEKNSISGVTDNE